MDDKFVNELMDIKDNDPLKEAREQEEIMIMFEKVEHKYTHKYDRESLEGYPRRIENCEYLVMTYLSPGVEMTTKEIVELAISRYNKKTITNTMTKLRKANIIGKSGSFWYSLLPY